MSAVVEAIEGIVDFAGDVVQGVLDDPLTAIATAAAFSMGMPFLGLKAGALAAGVANTAAGLVQGEDFDEAIKGGVMAGATSWAGGKIFGSAADDAAAAAAKSNSMNASSSYGAEAIKSSGQLADDAIAATGKTYYTPQSGYGSGTVQQGLSGSLDDVATGGLDSSLASKVAVKGADLGDDFFTAGQKNYLDASMAGGQGAPVKILDAEKFANTGSNAANSYAGNNLSQYVDDAGKPLLEAKGNVTGSSYGTTSAPSSYQDIGATNLGKTVGAEPNLYTDAAAQSAGSGYNIIDAAGKELTGYWDDVAGYGGKAIDWAAAHPIAATTGVVGTGAALKYLSDKKDEGEDEAERQRQEAMRREMAQTDETYYSPLPTYTLKRNTYTPYTEEQLYSYGEDPYGEGKFFSQGIYEPYYGYADGGAVMPQQMPQQPKAPSRVNPAFAFYRYGNVPESVRRYEGGGYAQGGSRGDGRSDHIEALLSPGEFVMDAETVSMLGNGSSEAGARRLEEMRQAVRKQKGGALAKGKFSPDAKSPLAYLSKKR